MCHHSVLRSSIIPSKFVFIYIRRGVRQVPQRVLPCERSDLQNTTVTHTLSTAPQSNVRAPYPSVLSRQRNSFHMSTAYERELDVLDRMIAEATGKKNELAKMHVESKAS
jgi:hypothetical protein